jgi:hypothetical protein
MESLPEELWEIVILFLSLKEKINVRRVSYFFGSYKKRYYLTLFRLEKQIYNFISIERKEDSELILTINNNFILYTDYKKGGVHSVFRINNHQHEQCLDVNCREKRLGNIYFSNKKTNTRCDIWNLYTRHKMPYCLNCFNKWIVDSTSNILRIGEQ